MPILFKIDQFDDKNLLIKFVPGLASDIFAELHAWCKGFKERFWSAQDGGWRVALTSETRERIDGSRYKKDVDFTFSMNAAIMFAYERATDNVNVQRASTRWDYIFDDKDPGYWYPSVLKPMQHQRVAVQSMKHAEYFGLLMEMGTGKSKCVVDEIQIYHNDLKENEIFKALIVCPKSLRRNWSKEFEKNFAPFLHYSIFILNSINIPEFADWLMHDKSKTKILIVSYDLVKNIEEFLVIFSANYVAMDESHYVKNPEGKRFKALRKVVKNISMRRILTGTPVSNNILDLWAQFELLRPGCLGFNSFRGFKAEFCNITTIDANGRDIDKVTGFKNLEKLKENMAKCSFIVKKERCLDLPDVMHEIRSIEMTPSLRAVYDQFANEFFCSIDASSEMKTDVVIAQMTKLSQLCCGFANATKVVRNELGEIDLESPIERVTRTIEGGDEKMNAMIEDAEDVVKYSKLIIWCRFHFDIDAIHAKLTELGIDSERFDGRVHEDKRNQIVDRFNNDSKLRVIIAQPAAGGVGLTLLGNQDSEHDACTVAFFYSNGYSLGQREQAEARNHRIGQRKKVLYRDYVYEGTIEETIAKVLNDKREIANMMKDVNSIKDILRGKT